MPIVQIYLTNAGTIQAPVVIPLSLYGKYKIAIMSCGYISSHTNQQCVQFRSRQLLLDFAGSYASLGTDADQSLRHPSFIVSGTNAVSGGNMQIPTGHRLEFYSEFNGQFEVYLVDLIDQVPARLTACVLTLDITPVDTTFGSESERDKQMLTHTFTQIPKRF